MGDASVIWAKSTDGTPKNLQELPAEFLDIVDHALKILYWQENLVEKEMPPFWMWHLDHELNKWFEKVKNERQGEGRMTPSGDPEELEHENNLYFERKREELKGRRRP